MSSKAYRATRVNDVNWEQIARGKEGLGVTLGVDVGKFDLWVVCRWADGRFERPWRVKNPWEIPTLVAVLKQVKADRKLVVAMEPSGTYGEALRQALGDNGIEVQRVGTKASHDYAEVFDGVPSQHDGKDAAVVAELAALGKAKPWAYQAADSWEEELAYWVEEMVAQRQMLTPWQGRLEGLLARHWPEASQVLETFLRDVASDLEALWESPGVGRGRGRREAVGPLGSVAVVAGEDRGVVGRCAVECGCSRRVTGNSVRSRSTPSRCWPPGSRPIGRNGGCVSWPRGIRSSRRKARWWVCRRRVSCGRARVTRGTLIRRAPTARRWG